MTTDETARLQAILAEARSWRSAAREFVREMETEHRHDRVALDMFGRLIELFKVFPEDP